MFARIQSYEQPVLLIGNKNVTRNFPKFDYTIHTLKTVHQLLQEGHRKLRFLQMPNYEVRFGLEGYAGPHIPPHYLMVSDKATQSSAQCITDGDIKFNEQGEITSINHKSSDFLPLFDSLKWVLASLIANNVAFSEEFIIRELDSSGGFKANHQVNLQTLKEELLHILTPERHEAMVNNNQQATPYHFVKIAQEKQITRGTKRKLAFDTDSLAGDLAESPIKRQRHHPVFTGGADLSPIKSKLEQAHSNFLKRSAISLSFEDLDDPMEDENTVSRALKF